MDKKRIIICLWVLVVFFPGLTCASGNDPPFIQVTIGAFVDTLLYVPESEPGLIKEVEDIINFVSRVFERKFQIKLKIVSINPWEFLPNSHELPATYTDVIAKLENPAYDLVLIFTGRKLFTCKPDDSDYSKEEWSELTSPCPYGETKETLMGSAAQNGTNAIIVLSPESPYIALHEIGHLFGAEHTREFSIMRPQLSPVTEHFDDKNKEKILKNRRRFMKNDL